MTPLDWGLRWKYSHLQVAKASTLFQKALKYHMLDIWNIFCTMPPTKEFVYAWHSELKRKYKLHLKCSLIAVIWIFMKLKSNTHNSYTSLLYMYVTYILVRLKRHFLNFISYLHWTWFCTFIWTPYFNHDITDSALFLGVKLFYLYL